MNSIPSARRSSWATPSTCGCGPGLDIIAAHGGLHRFMAWDKPDPHRFRRLPGVQLGACARSPRRASSSPRPIDGAKLFLTPEISMQIQTVLNSDIVMIFDECTPYGPPPATRRPSRCELSLRWAQRSRDEFDRLENNPNACSASSRAACARTCATNRGSG
ncbi:MAG: tRNA-guanine transglycosylase [Chiayiivirga sp.]|nr:tRNA-guanine transglycosylase [Chiayiivirga sp.]